MNLNSSELFEICSRVNIYTLYVLLTNCGTFLDRPRPKNCNFVLKSGRSKKTSNLTIILPKNRILMKLCLCTIQKIFMHLVWKKDAPFVKYIPVFLPDPKKIYRQEHTAVLSPCTSRTLSSLVSCTHTSSSFVVCVQHSL